MTEVAIASLKASYPSVAIAVDFLQYNIYNIMKWYILVLYLLLTLTFADDNEIRFADAALMREHHHHTNPSNEKLKIFLIPHSHDDVGWLKTVDEYYYGDNQQTQWAAVQYTIDTVVTELNLNPNYKFSIVEIAFLYRWWNNANSTQRNLLTKFVKNGQIEIINAGWCMSDEANPYYQDIIDQMSIGLRWVKQTLGVVPTVGWHIDPFGHQSSNAALFSQLGFNGWFFARVDYQDKILRLQQKALEMVWKPYQYSNNDNSIFTHVLYYMYNAPPGFCFDNTCRDEPIKDDVTLEDYNLQIRVNSFVSYFKSMAVHYRSSNLLHCLGQDFSFSNARLWYLNMDKIIKYVNSHPEFNMEVIYSTPGQYLSVINKQQISYPNKFDDFFPYADRTHGYWTGYFTSRISLKGFVRDLGRYAQSVRSHLGLLKLANRSQFVKSNAQEVEAAIWELEMALGILQHHDAVAGTAKQVVTYDYFNIGLRGYAAVNKVYRQVAKEQIKSETAENITDIFETWWNKTSSEWGISKALAINRTVLVNLYNPGAKGTYQIKLKIESAELNIVNTNNATLPGDLICGNAKNTSDCELFFDLPFEEASYNYVKLVPVKSGGSVKIIKLKSMGVLESTVNLTISSTASVKVTKKDEKFEFRSADQSLDFTLIYSHYDAYQGSGQKSGAYIFRPSNSSIDAIKTYSTIKDIHYAQGESVVLVALQGDKTYTKIYFRKAVGYVQQYGFEVETFVDSIDISDKQGKEIVLTLNTPIKNDKTFYTDSNGLEELKRILDYRPTWKLVNDEAVAGNYYPINSHISIIDTSTLQKVTVLVDRSQGGASIRPGQIEILIHRRLTEDDERGVFEALNETQSDGNGLKQLIRHWIVLGNNNRLLQKRNDQKIVISWSNTNTTHFSKKTNPVPAFSVPEDVKVYVRPFTDGTYLLRLHNFNTEHSNLVRVPLTGWNLTEMTLGGNQLLSEWTSKKYKWRSQATNSKVNHMRIEQEQVSVSDIMLKPFEIKTYKLIIS